MTDRLFTDGPGPFDLTPTGVPLDLLPDDGVEPRDSTSAFLRIDAALLEDESIGDLIADAGAAGLGLWLALLADAKEARAFGVLSFNAFSWGGRFGSSVQDVTDALRAMERAELIHLRIDGRRCMVRVRRWHRWQAMTDAERARLYRARTETRDDRTVLRDDRTETRDNVTRGVTTPETGDRRPETSTTTPTPPARASAPVPAREGAAVAAGGGGSMADQLTDALGALLPDDPARARALADDVVFTAFQRKAQFRFGLTADALLHGVAVLVSKRPWSPDDATAYIVSQAKRYNPEAPDLSLPTIENGDPRDRPTIPSDPAFTRFDG